MYMYNSVSSCFNEEENALESSVLHTQCSTYFRKIPTVQHIYKKQGQVIILEETQIFLIDLFHLLQLLTFFIRFYFWDDVRRII